MAHLLHALRPVRPPVYNTAIEGLTPTTTVVVDSTNGIYQTKVIVTVTGGTTSGLNIPIRRYITVAAA